MGRARKDEMREANHSHVGHFMDGGRAGAGSGAGMGYGDRSGYAAPGSTTARPMIGPQLPLRPAMAMAAPVGSLRVAGGASAGPAGAGRSLKRDRDVPVVSAKPIRKPPEVTKADIITKRFSDRHLLSLPGKDKTKDKKEGRREIDQLFAQRAKEISRNRFDTDRDARINTVVGLTPKKMKRLDEKLRSVDKQRDLATGADVKLHKVKSRVAVFERGKLDEPTSYRYDKRSIKVRDSNKEQHGSGTYLVNHFPEQVFKK